MRRTLLAMLLIPALVCTTLFGVRLTSTYASQATSVHPMVPCSGIPTPC